MTSKINKYENQIKDSVIQREMHLPSEESKELFSVHQSNHHKTLWYKSSWETMTEQNVPSNPQLVTYTSKVFPYHSLHRSLLSTITPKIKAKEGYTIRFCDYLFINMIKEFRLSFNDIEIQYGNAKSLLFELQSNPEMERFYKELSASSSWSDCLEPQFISIYIPWCYSLDKNNSFPLHICGQNDRLEHTIDFNLDLSQLILISNDSGEIVEFDKDLIEVEGNLSSISIPELEGLYTIYTDKECDYFKCFNEDKKEKEYYSKSIYYIEDENETVFGKKVHLKFDSKYNLPVDSAYWGAMNVTKSEENKETILHYLDSKENILSPIKTTKLESSFGVIIDNKSSFKTERGYSLSQFQKTPELPGYNFWKNSILKKDDPRKFVPGINMKGGSITITLKEKQNKLNNKYLAFCILNHTKKFIFSNFPLTQQERLKNGATLTLIEEN